MTAVPSQTSAIASDLDAAPLSDDELASAAVHALFEEALLTPKPGLVDLRGSGAHRDMTVAMMIASADALRDTFRQLAQSGRSSLAGASLRAELGRIGRAGERTMDRATGGVNTHRGAIWALGLTVAAAARRGQRPAPGALLSTVAAIAAHDDPASAFVGTKGREVRARYRVGGAVGAARAGFPLALGALTTMRRAMARGAGPTHARLDALLHCIARLDDTCLLSRGGRAGLIFARGTAAEVLRSGGTTTEAGMRALERFDRALVDRRLSPGGSADMLALAMLLEQVTIPDEPPTPPPGDGEDQECKS
ncbi:triphosphoribosyl-dephospho-CoA synthase [Actinoplanes subtropicus]|uniref:triphosphoribosyl-dephospho-CoA synthase n=1 Tax=Actinoplanes subtropicus TaxID=543632 RepID=UPI00068C9633|nr:triphosphoribosyl-dephospho-CoA synthase [Actinoplanes subtropicus]